MSKGKVEDRVRVRDTDTVRGGVRNRVEEVAWIKDRVRDRDRGRVRIRVGDGG